MEQEVEGRGEGGGAGRKCGKNKKDGEETVGGGVEAEIKTQ